MKYLAIILACLFAAPAVGGSVGASVVVGVKEAPPFVIKRVDGSWGGLAVRLWDRIAAENGVVFEYEERETVPELLEDVSSGDLFAGVGAITVTRPREVDVDFTHAYYNGGLGIAVRADKGSGFWRAVEGLMTPAFFSGVGSLVLLLLVIGFVVWFVEHRKNDDFSGSIVRGLGNGFWFSAVTMTTVGYGDKAPRTPLGRLVSLIWMFASIIVISFFTGAIASAFTASRIDGLVQGPADLAKARVGVIDGTIAGDLLAARLVTARRFGDLAAGIEALEAGELDAFVHDNVILQYYQIKEHSNTIRLVDGTFAASGYAIALPEGSEHREGLNRSLLEAVNEARWAVEIGRTLAAD
ncbi:MAG: transporter substrate-binding domain-containing protein [Planctomycetota bacterium]